MKSGLRFLFPLCLMAVSTAVDNDCQPGEQQVEFHLFRDDDSNREQSWTLSCDDGTTPWDVELKTSNQHNMPNSVPIKDEACIPDTVTCAFTIQDTYGDGLLDDGYYVLIHGATTVAAYDRQPFTENSYCFGPSCPTPTQEEEDECAWLYFFMKLDGRPHETSYSVVCNGETVLEGSGYTVPMELIEEESCIPVNSCCVLTVNDDGNDGLTSAVVLGEEEDGKIFMEFLSEVVLEYNGSSGEEFTILTQSFGLGC